MISTLLLVKGPEREVISHYMSVVWAPVIHRSCLMWELSCGITGAAESVRPGKQI
jgi:hypothetical protein